jgi:hypothetical protein
MVCPGQAIRTAMVVGLSLLLSHGCGSSRSSKDAGTIWGDVAIPQVAKSDIGNQVFDEHRVESYYLTFSDEEYAKLMDLSTILVNSYTVNEDRYVQAALKVGDTELPAIGVRFKGNYSIWGCVDQVTHQRVKRVEPFFGNIDVCQRFSLKLDLDRYDDHFRLDGLKKVNLHAMAADPSKLRERLGYSLFRDMDIPAPRAVHARVYINGAYQGLFAVVEEVDGRFTANRFPAAGDGNLYRDLWPSARTTDTEIKNALRTNDAPGTLDVSDFTGFKNAVVASTAADFATRMAPSLDFDQLARYIVVDRAINNYDGIMAFYYGSGWGPSNGNHYWYDEGGGHFTLIPWDFDKTFWYPEPYFWSDNAPHDGAPVPNWNVVTGDCNGETVNWDMVTVKNGVRQEGECQMREIDCDPLMKLLRGQIYDRQLAIAQTFVAGPFSEASVAAKIGAWQAQIADAVGEDPGVDSAHWQTWVDNLRADLPKLQGNLLLTMSGLIPE